MEPLLLTPEEVCTLSRISTTTFGKLCRTGDGPRCVVINGKRYIRPAAAQAWVLKLENDSLKASLRTARATKAGNVARAARKASTTKGGR